MQATSAEISKNYTQQQQNEHPARRIGGERMDRCQHPRTDQEGAEQAQPEGDDGEEHRPTLEGVPFLDDDRGMQERRGAEPGDEAGVLNRVPEPEAAPAEFVISPPGTEADAYGQAAPGR